MKEKKKTVSLMSTVLFTICSVIALDSFVSPAIIGVPVLTVWVIAAVFFFVPYGFISAELGASYPDDGGITSWTSRAFGEFHGVMVGWMYWVNVAFWMPAVFTAFSGWVALAFFPGMPLWVQGILAVLMCWGIVLIGIRGMDFSIRTANFMAVLKVSVLVLFGIAGILYTIKNGAANDFHPSAFIPGADETIRYTAVIIYNLMGFELIGSIGSRIEDAKRTVPRMIVIAGILITVLYAFGTFGILAAVPASEIDEVDGFILAMRELFTVFGKCGKPLYYVVSAGAVFSLAANMITWTLGSNESFQAAGLHERSALLAHRHPVYGTSDGLYILMGIISTVLIVLNYALSGDANEIFWTIFRFSSLVFMLCYLYMFTAFIVLKYKDPKPRAYEVPLGKPGAWILFSLCFAGTLLACYFLTDWDAGHYGFWMEWIGLAWTIAMGVWLYRAGVRKKKNRDC
ncbi:MAG: APC family permease [Erysipelotrichales bacterium]|nr:APC family permease [Erysipelotrichales bacterium]